MADTGRPLSGAYKKDVIENLMKSYSDKVILDDVEDTVEAEPSTDPLDCIEPPTFKCKTGEKRFSALFWKPKNIPDIPIRVYEATDWDEEAQLYIPPINPNWVWNRDTLEWFALAMHEGDTTLLHGLQGTGKSCLVEQWCALLNIPFWRMSCNRETREQHFLGSPGVTYNEEGQMAIQQEPTLLTDSLKYGGVFCEDEAFRHNSALVLQSLREKSNRTVVLPDAPGKTASERKIKAPDNWWYVLTDNTCGSGDETGIFDAEVQDASTLDRIDATIEVDYLSKGQERTMLKKHSNLDVEVLNGMLDLSREVRKAFKKQTLMNTLSVRGLMAWCDKAALMGNVGKGLQMSWYNKLGTDDQKVVDDMFYKVFARKINE